MTKKIPVKELAFNIVEDSERMEDFIYNSENVKSNNSELMHNISKEVIMEFLGLDDTKVWVEKNKLGEYDIIAYNKISDEKVRISNLGNHFMALIKIVKRAERFSENPDMPLLDHKFIKDINLQILLNREGEVGVGDYRYLDFLGRPVKMGFGKLVDGQKVRTGKCVELEKSDDKNITKKMTELINWVNNDAFKNQETVMDDIARFHAEFCRIHPFCDGNGRTCRLITNYLLLTQGENILNIPPEHKVEYVLCLNYANAKSTEAFINENDDYRAFYENAKRMYGERDEETKYLPLINFLKHYTITTSNDLINNILGYRGNNLKNFSANQI